LAFVLLAQPYGLLEKIRYLLVVKEIYMTFWDTIKEINDSFFHKNPIGKAIEKDALLAWNELVQVAEHDLKQIAEQVATAVLAVLASPGALSPQAIATAAIAAGIEAAVVGFKAAGHDVTVQTLSTLATTVVNQCSVKAA
jgi:hypothetical protein